MIDNQHYSILIENEDFQDIIFKYVGSRDTDSSATNLKLEALWILINLAYGDDDVILKFFFDNKFIEAIKVVMMQSL